ncbi:MAG: hypothetical protein IJ218_05545 [Alphaproteobacteria bacterium]|nr:hypothetical protein [Alphaproteobacteria bacterium]
MKFVLFLIKTLSLILCMGLLGAYFYYAFFAEVKSQFMADASLLLFVLSAVITALTIVLSENKIKAAPTNGLDAYLTELRKEEKNTAKQIQNALPKDLLPMLEKTVAAIDENKESLNNVMLDSKTAFSSALSENKSAMSSMLTETQSVLNASVAESMHMLDARIAEKHSVFNEILNKLLEQVSALNAKNNMPVNLALENINTRLDDLANKIVSNRVGSLAPEIVDKEEITTLVDMAKDAEHHTEEAYNTTVQADSASDTIITQPMYQPEPDTEMTAADSADTVRYDFTSPLPEEENTTDFAVSSTVAEPIPAEEPIINTETAITEATDEQVTSDETVQDFGNTDTSGYDFGAWNTPTDMASSDGAEDATTKTNTSDYDFSAWNAPTEMSETDLSGFNMPQHIESETDMASSVSDYANNLASNEQTNQRDAFSNDLSALADLEIMQEPVAPTAEPKFDEIDIDEFLKGRSDVKN